MKAHDIAERLSTIDCCCYEEIPPRLAAEPFGDGNGGFLREQPRPA
jgi:hypothetical protein